MLCCALKQAYRLSGAVVILVVLWGIGVRRVGRVRVSVVVSVSVVRCIRLSWRICVVILAVGLG
jgi:hypothetical protein